MHLVENFQVNQALGGDVSLTIVTDATLNVQKIFDDLWQQVYLFERQFSRFLPSSELSILNRNAGVKQYITSEFTDLLKSALKMSRLTAGLYNPFILPALQRAGYHNSAVAGYENDRVDDHSLKMVVSSSLLKLQGGSAIIPYGTAIDMGGCGKGYLADQLARSMRMHKIEGYWFSLGGDIVAGGNDVSGRKWELGVQDAEKLDDEIVWKVSGIQPDFAVATSGTFKREGQNLREDWHHIIDPITLKPAKTDIKLATVVAKEAIVADVLASCAVILGSKKAAPFLKSKGAQAFLLQYIDKDGGTRITSFGKGLILVGQEMVNGYA